MNYLVLDYNRVFVAKKEPRTILQHIRNIELLKPTLSGCYVNTKEISFFCQQVVNLLNNDFASGFAKIEELKQKLQDELIKGNCDLYAVWEASNILSQLKISLNNSYAFDALPQCKIALSMGRDAMTREVGSVTNSSAMKIVCQALSLVFKVIDVSNAGKMYWFYNTIVELIDETSPYPNEQNLRNWAKAQRGYAFFAITTSVLGEGMNVAKIIDEATAKRDVETYGQKDLSLR